MRKRRPNFVGERRLGRFTIMDNVIRTKPRFVLRIMRRMIIVRAEYVFHSNAIEYEAYSRLFEPCDEGFDPPYYFLGIHPNGSLEASRP